MAFRMDYSLALTVLLHVMCWITGRPIFNLLYKIQITSSKYFLLHTKTCTASKQRNLKKLMRSTWKFFTFLLQLDGK